MVTLGTGEHVYEVSGENWGKIPEDWFYQEATSVDVDSKGDLYVAEVSYAEFGRLRQPPTELRSLQKLVKKG